MGLFDKKTCDICGEKIGLLGNRKLDDGNMCKDCLKLASPYLTGRKQFTVSDMKDHLEYREQNKAKVEAFNPTTTFGTTTKVYLDEGNGLWLVSSSSNYKRDNPDVMTIDQVTGCNLDVRESRTEIRFKKSDGSMASYNPPRYDIDYDFYIEIFVNSQWFTEIEFKVNSSKIKEINSAEYRNTERQSRDIKEALTKVHGDNRARVEDAAKPRTSIVCPNCQATTLPDESGRCEFCGGATGV